MFMYLAYSILGRCSGACELVPTAITVVDLLGIVHTECFIVLRLIGRGGGWVNDVRKLVVHSLRETKQLKEN
jgi:hypothetical protein